MTVSHSLNESRARAVVDTPMRVGKEKKKSRSATSNYVGVFTKIVDAARTPLKERDASSDPDKTGESERKTRSTYTPRE